MVSRSPNVVTLVAEVAAKGRGKSCGFFWFLWFTSSDYLVGTSVERRKGRQGG